MAITEQFGEEYIKASQEILPAMFKEKKYLLKNIEDGKVYCNTGSTLINHLIKLVIPFQNI